MTEASHSAGLVRRAARQDSRRRRRDRLTLVFGWLCLGAGSLALWQALSGRVLDPFFFSSPGQVWSAFYGLARNGELVTNAVPTLVEAGLGYTLGVAAGVLLAGTLGLSHRAYVTCEPFIMALYSIPAVALAPVLIVAFGVGPAPKVFLAAYLAFLVIFINTVTGIRAAPPDWLQMARLLGATRAQVVAKVVLPAAGPYLLAGLKAALPQAAIGAVVGEFIASQHGIGYLISSAAARFNTAGVFASLFILAASTGLLSLALNRAAARRFGGVY